MSRFMGADWLQKELGYELSEFGALVADMLGLIHRGIYHLEFSELKKWDWRETERVIFNHYGSLSTWDYNHLTSYVLLCSEHGIRFAVHPTDKHMVRLMFHKRDPKDESVMSGIKSLDEQKALILPAWAEYRASGKVMA